MTYEQMLAALGELEGTVVDAFVSDIAVLGGKLTRSAAPPEGLPHWAYDATPDAFAIGSGECSIALFRERFISAREIDTPRGDRDHDKGRRTRDLAQVSTVDRLSPGPNSQVRGTVPGTRL